MSTKKIAAARLTAKSPGMRGLKRALFIPPVYTLFNPLTSTDSMIIAFYASS
jgi:hypothetical protein